MKYNPRTRVGNKNPSLGGRKSAKNFSGQIKHMEDKVSYKDFSALYMLEYECWRQELADKGVCLDALNDFRI